MGSKNSEQMRMHCELEFKIHAPVEEAWRALIEDINLWWLGSFRVVDANSTLELDVQSGGKGLVERLPDGSFLQWYSVQAYLPQQRKIYLVGNLAPDFGGPSTSNLLLEINPLDDGCCLRVTDAHHGVVNEKTMESLKGGWQELFGDGFRDYLEQRANL